MHSKLMCTFKYNICIFIYAQHTCIIVLHSWNTLVHKNFEIKMVCTQLEGEVAYMKKHAQDRLVRGRCVHHYSNLIVSCRGLIKD